MGENLKDKVAVITGAGRGIGRGVAMAMADEGARVVVNDLGGAMDGSDASAKVADEVVDEIKRQGGVAVANYDTVATHEGGDNIIKTAIDNFGTIDILVNNAGILRDRMLWNMTDDEWDDVIKTHLYGHFYCTRAAVIQMRTMIKEGEQKRGSIINFSSISGLNGSAINPNYCAAKMGIVGFTYSSALALRGYGINCNAILPEAATRLTASSSEREMRQAAQLRGMANADSLPIEEIKATIGYGGNPDAIGPVACWLASDEAQHITGQLFMVAEGHVGYFSHIEEANSTFKNDMFTSDEVWQVMPELTTKLTNPAL